MRFGPISVTHNLNDYIKKNEPPVNESTFFLVCERCVGNKHLFEESRKDIITKCFCCGQQIAKAAYVNAVASIAIQRLRALIESDPPSYSHSLRHKTVRNVIQDNLTDSHPSFVHQLIQVIASSKSSQDLQPDQDQYWNYLRSGQQEQECHWESFRLSFRNKSRFFNKEAQTFLEKLFGILKEQSLGAKPERQLEAGYSLFRARRANSEEEVEKISGNPKRELHAPPPALTPANRMNVERVPAFYAAVCPNTAVAEVRPSRGCRVLVAGFKTTRRLKIFDFTALKKTSAPTFSIWASDFVTRSLNRTLLLNLQDRIARPIPLGMEHEYFDTQVVADFLHFCLDFDGVMFESTQEKDGINVVLFAATLGVYSDKDSDFPDAPLLYEEGSLQVHEVTELKVVTKEIGRSR